VINSVQPAPGPCTDTNVERRYTHDITKWGEMIMPISEPILVPDRFSEEVRKQVLDGYMREPVFDPTLAKKVSVRSKR
jgi:hypothetical protein